MSNKQLASVLKETVEVVKEIATKFNPRHEPSSGRFASGGAGGKPKPSAKPKPKPKPNAEQKPGKGGSRKNAREKTDDVIDRDYDDLAAKRNPISLSAASGMKKYAGDFYYEKLNKDLRGGKDIKNMSPDIVSLNNYCKQKLPGSTITYRGVSEERINKMVEGAGKGGVIKAKGFVSTSTSLQTASDWGSGAVMEIKAKSGGVVGKFALHSESEIIQAHGTKYKFLGKDKTKDFYGDPVNIYMFEEV